MKEAQIQKDVFTHMIGRISKDLLQVRRDGADVEAQLSLVEKERAACAAQLQQAGGRAEFFLTALPRRAAEAFGHF